MVIFDFNKDYIFENDIVRFGFLELDYIIDF